jgi:hypothetical protein
MTNLTEIRRPGFEAEYAKKYGKQPGRWGMDQGKYRMEHAEVAWWGYNAALDSVVVELPPAHADVLAERKRQVDAEGWTPEHDDEHNGGELAAAAAAYTLHAADHMHPYSQGDGGDEAPSCWPWHDELAGRGEGPERTEPAWWKPGTPRRDLIKACALILAEIERIDRDAGIKTK